MKSKIIKKLDYYPNIPEEVINALNELIEDHNYREEEMSP